MEQHKVQSEVCQPHHVKWDQESLVLFKPFNSLRRYIFGVRWDNKVKHWYHYIRDPHHHEDVIIVEIAVEYN